MLLQSGVGKDEYQPGRRSAGTRAGANRQTAYEAVQRAAMRTWKGDQFFAESAKAEPEISALLSASAIDALCSLDVHFRHVDETFRALGLE